MRTLIGFRQVVFAAVAAMGVNAWALTASSYKGAENMINQWDAIENVGVGLAHDSTATTWKDLKGEIDLTIDGTRGSWNVDNVNVPYFAFNGVSAGGAKTTAPYRTIEIVCAHDSGWIVFSSGNRSRVVIWRNTAGTEVQFNGTATDKKANVPSGNGTVQLAAIYDDATGDGDKVAAVYELGAARDDGTYTDNWSSVGGRVLIGGRGNDGYIGSGRIYAIRLYDRVLTDEELAYNAMVDRVRFSGESFPTLLVVSGNPENCGAVSPAYGLQAAVTPGTTVPFEAPKTCMSLDGTAELSCAGYKAYTNGFLYCEGAERTVNFVQPNAELGAEFVWQWERGREAVSIGTDGRGSVSPTNVWLDPDKDTEVTATAIPPTGFEFVRWEGELVPAGLETDNPITFTTRTPGVITAIFRGAYHVAANGDDGNDGIDAPFRTIGAALSAAHAGDVIQLPEGDFPMDGEVVVNKGVTIQGAGRELTKITQSGSGYRAFTLKDDDAVLADLTITGFRNAISGGAVSLLSGTVRDCIIEKCVHSGSAHRGGGVDMSGGLLLRCLVRDNKLEIGGGRPGAGVYLSGGVIDDCDICDNTSSHDNNLDQGEGVYLTGGTLRNSRIYRNNGCRTQSLSCAVFVDGDAALVENCFVTNNWPQGVHMTKGLVRNTVIARNGADDCSVAAGVCMSGGTLENCTVYGNASKLETRGCSGLEMTGGTAVNNIFWQNGTVYGGCIATAGTLATNIVDNAVGIGVFNRVEDPVLTGAATNDFHLAFGSAAIDVGATLAGVETDLEGTSRPQGEAPDLGAYEYVPGEDFTVVIRLNTDECGTGDAVTLTAVVSGEAASYAWFVDGEPAGSEETLTLTTLAPRRHSFKVVVTDGDGKEYADEKPDAVLIRPRTVFVATDGASVWPYDTSAKAATNLTEAYAALWKKSSETTTVEIAAGDYYLAEGLEVVTPVRFLGAGRDTTVIRQSKTGCHAFELKSEGAVVADLTMTGFDNKLPGGAISMSAGLVCDCIIEKSKHSGGRDLRGGGVDMSGGSLLRCVVRDNNIEISAGRSGGGIYMSGGSVEDCEIYNNTTGHDNNLDMGEGVYMTGGTVRNCRFYNHYGCLSQMESAAIYLAGDTALAENCIVTNNRPSGIHVNKGTARNCLVSGNYDANGIATGVSMTGGTLVNCTVAGNADSTDSLPPGLRMTGGTAVNSIIWGNGTNFAAVGSATVTGGTFVTNLVDVAVDGAGVIAADPKFRKPSAGNYRLKGGSPCIRGGEASYWAGVSDPLDLDGLPRLDQKGRVGLGCYAGSLSGLLLMVR